MSQDIWELANFNQFWKHVPTLARANYQTLALPEIFRVTLADLNHLYGERLPIQCFDSDSHDKYTIATDSYSFPHLLDLKDKKLYEASSDDGSGWIYIYSNIAEIGIGRCEEGTLWWKNINYKSRIKIGRTERHVFTRLKEQAVKAATALARKPVILGAFWSPQVVQDERSIHQRLASFKAENSGGTEWFECPSVFALKAVRGVLLENRQEQLEMFKNRDLIEQLESIFQQQEKNFEELLSSLDMKDRWYLSGDEEDFFQKLQKKLESSQSLLQYTQEAIQSAISFKS